MATTPRPLDDDSFADAMDRDSRQAMTTFVESGRRGQDEERLPEISFQSPASRVFGAQKVAVYRDEERVKLRLVTAAAMAGKNWYYSWPVKGDGGKTEWVEGPSIKLVDDLVTIYGNCYLGTPHMEETSTHWRFYSSFTDYETGTTRELQYNQRKSQRQSKKMDIGRQEDIAFQIGQSKSQRNVVRHALQTWCDFAMHEAKRSLTDKIGKDLLRWRDDVVSGLNRANIELGRVERILGRTCDRWLVSDVAAVISTMKTIADGFQTWDEAFPPTSGTTSPMAGEEAGDGEDGEAETAASKDRVPAGRSTPPPPAGNGAATGPQPPAAASRREDEPDPGEQVDGQDRQPRTPSEPAKSDLPPEGVAAAGKQAAGEPDNRAAKDTPSDSQDALKPAGEGGKARKPKKADPPAAAEIAPGPGAEVFDNPGRKTGDEYVAYFGRWVAAATSLTDIADRWARERNLRNALSTGPLNEEQLRAAFNLRAEAEARIKGAA